MELVQDDTGAFGPLLRLVLAKGVRNYIILAGEDREDLEERLGYCGADVMLYARTLGLDTWWVGGTFSRKAVRKKAGEVAGRGDRRGGQRSHKRGCRGRKTSTGKDLGDHRGGLWRYTGEAPPV